MWLRQYDDIHRAQPNKKRTQNEKPLGYHVCKVLIVLSPLSPIIHVRVYSHFGRWRDGRFDSLTMKSIHDSVFAIWCKYDFLSSDNNIRIAMWMWSGRQDREWDLEGKAIGEEPWIVTGSDENKHQQIMEMYGFVSLRGSLTESIRTRWWSAEKTRNPRYITIPSYEFILSIAYFPLFDDVAMPFARYFSWIWPLRMDPNPS